MGFCCGGGRKKMVDTRMAYVIIGVIYAKAKRCIDMGGGAVW
jgi:hypothetical protein